LTGRWRKAKLDLVLAFKTVLQSLSLRPDDAPRLAR
jgi:hypothetical protein